MKGPDAVGVPLIVIKLEAKAAVTPAGNPIGVPIPVAPVVEMVILGEIAVLIHTAGLEEGVPAVLFDVTVILPVAFTDPQPPVSGMV